MCHLSFVVSLLLRVSWALRVHAESPVLLYVFFNDLMFWDFIQYILGFSSNNLLITTDLNSGTKRKFDSFLVSCLQGVIGLDVQRCKCVLRVLTCAGRRGRRWLHGHTRNTRTQGT